MLPINLLPNYIFDKNKKRNVLIGYALALAAIVGFFLFMSAGVQKTLDEAKADLADATTKQSTYNNRVTDIQKVQGEIAEIKTKQTFIANAQTYNAAWPATFELFRNLTDRHILLKSMTLDKDHKTMRMDAFAPGDSNSAEFAIANWVKALESHTEILDHVAFNVPPHPFVGMNPTAGAGGGMPGGGGFAGSGGFGGKGMGMGMAGGGGPPTMSMSGGGAPGSGGFAGRGGIGGGAGGNNAAGPAEIEGKPGINFTVSATLKTPLANGMAAPAWPSSGSASAAPGGFGGGAVGPPAGMGGPPVGMPGGTPIPGGRD